MDPPDSETGTSEFYQTIQRNLSKPELIFLLEKAELDTTGLKPDLSARLQIHYLGYSSKISDTDVKLVSGYFKQTKESLVRECNIHNLKDSGVIPELQRRLVLEYLESKFASLAMTDDQPVADANSHSTSHSHAAPKATPAPKLRPEQIPFVKYSTARINFAPKPTHERPVTPVASLNSANIQSPVIQDNCSSTVASTRPSMTPETTIHVATTPETDISTSVTTPASTTPGPKRTSLNTSDVCIRSTALFISCLTFLAFFLSYPLPP